MTPAFLYQFIFRAMLRRPGRTVLTILGIALGVTVVGAIYLANIGSMAAFNASMQRLAGEGTIIIRNDSRRMTEQDLKSLSGLAELGVLTPVIDDVLWLQQSNGSHQLIRVMGIEPVSLAATEAADFIVANSNDSQGNFFGTVRKLAKQGAVLIPARFAKEQGLGLDSRLEVIFQDQVLNLTIAGITEALGRAKIDASPRVIMDIAGAQVLLKRMDGNGAAQFDYLELSPPKGQNISRLKEKLEEKLPDQFSFSLREDEFSQVERLTRAFHFNLSCLASLALIVGMFLVYNTIATSTILRRKEIAVQRSLGMSKGSITTLFLMEAAFYGVCGCIAGLLAAQWLAPTLIAGTRVTMSTFFISEAALGAVSAVDLPVGLILLAVVTCVVLAMLAAFAPARQAASEDIVAVLRGDLIEEQQRFSWAKRLLFAAFLCLAAYQSSDLPALFGLPIFGFFATLLMIAAAAVISRPVVSQTAKLISSLPVGALSKFFKLGASQARSGMRRVTVAVSALAVSVAMMVAIAILIESFRSTIVVWIDQTLKADLFIRSLARTSPTTKAFLSPEVGRWIKAQAEVADMSELATIDGSYNQSPIYLNTTDLSVPLKHGALVWKSAPQSADLVGQTFISESMSLKEKLFVGDEFEFSAQGQVLKRRVDGIFYDYSNTKSVVFIDSAAYQDIAPVAPEVTNIAVYLKAGVNAESFAERVRQHFGATVLLSLQSRSALKSDALTIFDSTFAITYTLELIALMVAGIGVLVTQLTLFFERLKEFGVMRSLGCSNRQIATVLGVGGLVTGLSSQVIGIVLGFGISLVLIYVVNVQSFGWTIQFHLPLFFILQLSIVLLAISLLLGSLPTLWLKRRGVIEVLREE